MGFLVKVVSMRMSVYSCVCVPVAIHYSSAVGRVISQRMSRALLWIMHYKTRFCTLLSSSLTHVYYFTAIQHPSGAGYTSDCHTGRQKPASINNTSSRSQTTEFLARKYSATVVINGCIIYGRACSDAGIVASAETGIGYALTMCRREWMNI